MAVTPLPKGFSEWSGVRLRIEVSHAERSRKPERAIALLEHAVRRTPDDWKSVRHLAHLLTRVGRGHDAKMHYRRLAEHYEQERLITSAIAVWKVILAIGPDLVGPHVKLGELYVRRGLRADARMHYREAVAGYEAEGRAREAAEIEARITELDEQSRLRLRSSLPAAAVPPSGDAPQPPIEGEPADDPVFRDDYENRYELGIAYREMGLLDEAIAELQLASSGPDRLVECARLLGGCFVEKGQPHLAVAWLERALAEPDLDGGQILGLRYDLASVLEACGEGDRARLIYLEIGGQDPAFRDVAERLRRLGETRDPGASGAERDSGGQAA